VTSSDPSYADLLASFAVTQFQMQRSVEDTRDEVVKLWRMAFESEPGLFASAAAAVASVPGPPSESTARTARLDPIREALGAETPTEALGAMLAARELLKQLADDYG
jgi:hypothetical protein